MSSDENKIKAEVLTAFAQRLKQHRPSAGQLELSPEYNRAVVRALEWAEREARIMASQFEEKDTRSSEQLHKEMLQAIEAMEKAMKELE